MKKIIKKFWGVALVVMMLSTLLVIPATPAAAAAYAFSNAGIVPSALTGVLAPTVGFGFVAVAQAGDVIYGTATDGAVNYLYKSVDGGATWAPCLAVGLPAFPATLNLIAVAPDDANYVVVVNTAGPAVYLSTNGGATFSNISDTVGAPAAINSIDISSLYGGFHYVLAGGNVGGPAYYLAKWKVALAAAWAPINVATAVPLPTSIQAVKYTPYPDIDHGFLFIGKTATDLSLHMYSDAFIATPVDPVGFNYPRVFATGAAVACTIAQIVLDQNFLIYDNEIGFIGSDVAGGLVPVTGGVWTMVGGLGKIQTLATFNSVAWDGTNMMSAGVVAVGAPTVYRSANALAGPGVAVFAANAPFKGPGAGTNPLVLFAGGDAYCLSAGEDGGVAMSADLGKSFNGVKLISSTAANPFNNVLDFWIKSDGSVIYALTSDGINVDLWGMSGGVWQRLTMLPVATYGATEIVRSAQSDTNAIYVAGPANPNRILKSIDGGTSWLLRSCTQNIGDLALQSATVAYVASSASGAVLKTANGCTSWTTLGALTAGAGYSIKLIADNQVVVGGTTGYVGYYDGTTWTAVTVALAAGPAVVDASGTATGDVIFAGTLVGTVGAWTIGTSVVWAADATAVVVTGIAYANGILYAYDPAIAPNPSLYRYYMPAITLAFKDTIVIGAVNFWGGNIVNSLQMAQGSNVLWACDAATNPDTLQSFTEYLLAATPTGTYPINGEIIPVNSLNGVVNPFLFQWTAPAVTAPLAGWTYAIAVYYDEAGTILVGALGPTVATNVNVGALLAALTPGSTYYWQVQITVPVHSFWSPMQSFTVQQLTAIVPVISSPPAGSTVETLQPGFSWEPIAGATTYEFQISKESSFTFLVFTDNATSAGESLPVAFKLDDGVQYYWRVRVIAPAVGEWSQVGVFTVSIPVTPPPTSPAPTPTYTIPFPSITVTVPQPTVIIPTPTEVTKEISAPYIWAIIIIGAVLVIAVIVLIVRTRRSV
jgi:hypothetical protein